MSFKKFFSQKKQKKLFVLMWFIFILPLIASCMPADAEQQDDSLSDIDFTIAQIFSIEETDVIPQTGENSPNFSFGLDEENIYELSHFEDDKPVLITFWTTWCGACRIKMPLIQDVHDQYDGKLQVLTVNIQEDRQTIHNFMQDNEYSFPVLQDNGTLGQRYFVQSIPISFLINRDGIIVLRHTGLMDRAEMEELLDEII